MDRGQPAGLHAHRHAGGRDALGWAHAQLPQCRDEDMARRDDRQGLDRADMAERLWRGGAGCGPGDDPSGGAGAGRRAPGAVLLRPVDARSRAVGIWHGGAEGPLPAVHRARRDPLVPRAIRSRARARTSLPCAPAPRTRATIGWSTGRRSGPAMPTRPTGSSRWCAPIRRRPSISASPSCSST